MDTYKDFVQQLTKITFDDVYLLLHDNISPKLKEYIGLLLKIKFTDGAYNAYYGKIKKIVTSFFYYYSQTIDDISVEADKYSVDVNKNDLLTLLEKTVNIYQINQVEYGREFLPVTNSMEREMYDKMEVRFNEHMIKLNELGEKIQRLDKQEKIDAFAREHFNITIQRISEVFVFTHGYIAMMLCDVMDQIRISLEEIHLRLYNNLQQIKEENEERNNDLLDKLYDKNKEQIFILCRQAHKCSIQNAEVSRGLELIKDKLENPDFLRLKSRIEEELLYWQHRLDDFQAICKIINGLKAEQKEMDNQEETYQNFMDSKPPGPKFSSWDEVGEKIRQRKEQLKEKIPEAARMLITFFSFRGTDRIFYTDKIGPYYVDEFNHQNYCFNYGLGMFHVNCDGEFVDVSETVKYYFDANGRYIFENGEKIYQCAPCTSKYKLNDSHLLTKITKDCGHSDNNNSKCRMEIKDLTDVEILPKTDIVDIKNTLSSEVVKYLWDSFGPILPEVLHDIGITKPKNPIHRLAHKLLKHHYSQTNEQLREISEQAQAYSADIFEKRKLKAESASKAWKAKQVKREKPREVDDVPERAAYEAHLAAQERVKSLNYYYD